MKTEKTYSRAIKDGCKVETVVTLCDGKRISEVIVDKDYYAYHDWIERYNDGLISQEMLDLIIIGDSLQRFVRAEDIKRNEGTDAVYAKTIEHEKKWEAAMILRRTNPKAWSFALNEIIGDIFPEIKTAVWSKGNSPVFLAGKGGSVPLTANSKIVKEMCV